MEDYGAIKPLSFSFIDYQRTLVPFFAITALLLVASMYMYYVQHFDEGIECNYTLLEWNMSHPTDEPILDVCTCDSFH
jgi:hypothetical protein